jgi:hypothetical protein
MMIMEENFGQNTFQTRYNFCFQCLQKFVRIPWDDFSNKFLHPSVLNVEPSELFELKFMCLKAMLGTEIESSWSHSRSSR